VGSAREVPIIADDGSARRDLSDGAS